MITRKRALALALGFACSGSAAVAKPTIVEFDAPNIKTGAGTMVTGIDDKGDVIGNFVDMSNTQHGFMRRADGSFLIYGATTTNLTAVNARQQTTGDFQNVSKFSGFIADPAGNMTAFDVSGAVATVGTAINDAGDIAGNASDANNAFHGFLRSKRGKFKTFDGPGAGTASGQGTFPGGIGSDDLVCGYYITGDGIRHGFVRDAGGTITTVDVTSSVRTVLHAINDTDTIVGYSRDTSNVYHGLIRTADGTLTSVDAQGAGTAALQGTLFGGINKKGIIAGQLIDSGNVNHSFVRTAKGKVTIFDPPDTALTAGLGSFSVGINTKNQIAGSYLDAGGVEHGYIRLP